MNDLKNSSNGLLVLKLSKEVSNRVLNELTDLITPLADKLGVEPLVLPVGMEVELKMGSSALLERVCVALEALVAQGQPPELSEPQIAPQALNARPSHLNPADYTLSKGEKVSTGLNSRPAELNAATLADMWARRNDKV
ncbi:hypothetical protein D3C85_569150 [compost metagenome]